MSDSGEATRYCRNQDLLSVEMDGDLVMMSVETGNYFGVSGIGPHIWDLLENPRNFSFLLDNICEEFEVDEATASADLRTFLNQLVENGMVEVS